MKTPKNLWKKALVFVVIGLFIGTSFVPSMSANIKNNDEVNSEENIPKSEHHLRPHPHS